MGDETRVHRPERLRLTTGMLMVWIALVAVGLAVVEGDMADWLPRGAIGWLAALGFCATVFLIPWLEYRLDRSPESLRPASARERRAVNLLAVGVLLCMASAGVLLIVLFSMILAI